MANICNRLRPGDDGKQAQQQNLTELISDLTDSPSFRQILEMTQEGNRRKARRFHHPKVPSSSSTPAITSFYAPKRRPTT
jgi:hypothetical protein